MSVREKGHDFGDSEIVFGLAEIEEIVGHPIEMLTMYLEM